MTRNSRIRSILFNKCPRCGIGDFFITRTAYTKKFDKMHAYCPHCGQNLVPEPGFYQGALYLSYSFYVAFLVVYFLIFNYFFETYFNYFLITVIPILILLTPVAYRLARRSWLAIFIKPKPD